MVVYLTVAPQDMEGQDVYYSWVEGKRILSGENPYARVLSGDMAENQKYATYFPAFYWLSALSQRLGLRDFPAWMAFWRVIFLGFDIGVAALIFVALDRYRSTLIGILAALFWLFNRWTLDLLSIADLDFLPLFFPCVVAPALTQATANLPVPAESVARHQANGDLSDPLIFAVGVAKFGSRGASSGF